MGAERFTKLLVLDLDETLIHARGRGEPELPWPAHHQVAQFRVHLRPGVEDFMERVLDSFVAVGVWTSASREYAIAMLERIVDRKRLRFIYTRERCEQAHDRESDEFYWIKDLTELEGFCFEPGQIVFVDDKPRGLERSADNLVPIAPFMGDPEDEELDKLIVLLEELGEVEDVRNVDKRAWWCEPN